MFKKYYIDKNSEFNKSLILSLIEPGERGFRICVAPRYASHKWPSKNMCRSSVCVSQMAEFFYLYES